MNDHKFGALVGDSDARELALPADRHHAALWHILDGVGGALTVPDFPSLPATRYVCIFRNHDGSVELVANDERPL